jgi:hypothetical protein
MEPNKQKEPKERKGSTQLLPREPDGGGRPPLTGPNATQVVNAILARNRNGPQGAQIKRDWRSFVRSQFHLTPVQQRNLDEIPPAEVAKIQQAANQAVDNGGAIRVHLGTDGGVQQGALTVTPHGSGSSPGTAESLMINIIEVDCTFDTDCSHWQCSLKVPGF